MKETGHDNYALSFLNISILDIRKKYVLDCVWWELMLRKFTLPGNYISQQIESNNF